MNTWDTLPVHDEHIPPGLSLAADCSLDIGAVRSSFWEELRDGLRCWREKDGRPLRHGILKIDGLG